MSKPGALKVVVTGAAGFIGGRLVSFLRGRGVEVISVDEPGYFKARKELRDVDFGEIVDREKLFDWLKTYRGKLDQIFHLGACTDTTEMDEGYLNKMNLQYSQEVWKYACEHKVPLIYASSAATYGDGQLGYDDDEALIEKLRPLNPYGESKRLFDLWALEQERAGALPPRWAGFKFFNVYGFGERHKGKMASVVLHAYDQILQTGGVKLFKSHRAGIADGHQKRDFVYVDDVIKVLTFAMSHKIPRGILNLGTGQARTFLDLVKAVFQALKKPEKIEFVDTPVAIRDRYQYFTEAKIARLRQQSYNMGFTTLEDGVKDYVDRLRVFDQRAT